MHSEQIDAAIAAFLQAEAEGENPDPQAWLEKYPELADDLRAFFADRARLENLVAPLRPVEAETLPPTGDWQAPAEPPTLAPGETPSEPVKVRYFGDYELLEEIARGGMGVVFKARQVSLNRVVALKMILAGNLAGEEDVGRFRTEAEAAANLDHPNIVPIYEVGEHGGQQYFSMKLIEGGSLTSLLSAAPQARRSVRKEVALLIPVAHAIHHAHQRGILHRDLKPGNILLDRDKQPHVTDFGLAKKVEGDSGMTRTGAIVGTPSYMAPEQAAAMKQLTTAVDVYSLGAILYEILTGRPPFREATPLETLMQVVDKDPDPPRKLNPSVDRDLETICLKCLEKEPEKRYGSAQALAEELERWQRGEPILARPLGTVARLWKWGKRHPGRAAVAGLGLIALLGLSAAGVLGLAWVQESQRASSEAQRAGQAEVRSEQLKYIQQITLSERNLSLGLRQRTNQVLDATAPPYRSWEWAYLKSQCVPALRSWDINDPRKPTKPNEWNDGHCEKCGSLVCHPKGVLIAADCIRGWDTVVKVRVWNLQTGRVVYEIPQAKEKGVSFSPDGRWLMACRFDPEKLALIPTLYDAQTGKEGMSLYDLGGDARLGVATKLTFTPDSRFVVGIREALSLDGTSRVRKLVCFDCSNGKLVTTFVVGKEEIRHLAFTRDGKLLTVDDDLTHWELATGKELRRFTLSGPGSGQLHSHVAAFSTDRRWLAIAAEQRILLFDTLNGAKKLEIKEEISASDSDSRGLRLVRQLCFSPDGRYLFSGGGDSYHGIGGVSTGAIRAWEVASGKQVLKLHGHIGCPDSLTLTPDGQVLLWSSADSHVQAWNLAGNRSHLPIKSTPASRSVAMSPDGHTAALDNGQVHLYDTRTGNQIRRLPTHLLFGGLCPAFSPQGDILVGGMGGGWSLAVWDVKTWKRLRTLPLDSGELYDTAFNPDGKFVAMTGGILNFGVWNVHTGNRLWTHSNANAFCVAFSPDGKTLAWGTQQTSQDHLDADRRTTGAIVLADPQTGNVVRTLRGMKAGITRVSFSPDGHFIAGVTGGHYTNKRSSFFSAIEPQITVWDVATGSVVATMLGHTDEVNAVLYSRDGKRLFSGSKDKTIKVWDAATGQEMLTLHGHRLPVVSLALDKTGHQLLSGGMHYTTDRHGEILLWSAEPIPPFRTVSIGQYAMHPPVLQLAEGWDLNQLLMKTEAPGPAPE